jgi:hypothetical protein
MRFYVLRKIRPRAFPLEDSIGFRAWIAASRRVYLGSDVVDDPNARQIKIGSPEESEFTEVLRQAAARDTSAATASHPRALARLAMDTVRLLEFNSPDSAFWFDMP